jgi:hypothetical protein
MSESEDKERKEYEAELQRRLRILKEQIVAGKVKFARGMKVLDSLQKVRYAPDGTVDLSTVDGLVRAAALGVAAHHDREELKKGMPLNDIQHTYFTFLENNFGPYYKEMVAHGLSPHSVGKGLSRNPSAVGELTKNLEKFLEVIEEFWSQTADVAHAHVEDMQGNLKGVFGGDLFPSNDENIASKCGLYTDTIILPDPFLRSKDLFKLWTPEKRTYYLMKHGLNLLQYKDLACADLPPPIVIILPDRTEIEEAEKDFIHKLGERDALVHAGRIFGREFASFDGLMDFASSLGTVDRLLAEVADGGRLLFNTEWPDGPRNQIENAIADATSELVGTKNPGILVALGAVGRMSISNELLVKARRLRGTPIIDAPTSWQYFVWKLEYDAQNVEKDSNIADLHVLRGLQSVAENQMEWLGRVPPAALIELRKSGGIHEIRDIIRKGVDELSLAEPTNFHGTTEQVFQNIQAGFVEHRKRIEELRSKKWTFAGTGIGSWLVVGTLAVTAAATRSPVWGLAAMMAHQVLPAPELKDIPKSIQDLARETEDVKQSPVGLLFRYSGEKA